MIGFENLEENTIDMTMFPLKWRFTEENYNILSQDHLEQLKPLNEIASNFLYNYYHKELNLHEDMPFTKGFFKFEESIRYEIDHEKTIKKWLYKRGIPFDKKVYLSWNEDLAMLVPWKLLVKYFDDFYYGASDDLTVFDESLNWAILFFHTDDIYFGTNENYKIKPIK